MLVGRVAILPFVRVFRWAFVFEKIRPVEHFEILRRLSVQRVRGPAARFHLLLVDAPEAELFLEQRSADVRGAVQFAGPVEVHDLLKDARMAVEKVLVLLRIVVREVVPSCDPGQPSVRKVPQRTLERLVTYSADVQNNTVFDA